MEGQSVSDFLQWSIRESGLRLKYGTKGAEIYASSTILHGDLYDLDPDKAVEPVLASTHSQVVRGSNNTLLILLPDQR